MKIRFGILAMVCVTAASAQAQPAPTYTVTKSVPIGAPDGWDYVVYDPSLDRVYIGHGTETTIVDGNSGAVVGHFKGRGLMCVRTARFAVIHGK